jgi:hypothetical protein
MPLVITHVKNNATKYKLARRARDIASKYLDKRDTQEHWVYKIRRLGGHQGKGVVVPVRWIIEFRLNNENGPIVGWLRLL